MALTDALPEMQREIRFFPVKNDEPKHLSKAQVEQYNTGVCLPGSCFYTGRGRGESALFR